MEKPEDLAEWVLREQSDWSRDRVIAAMHGTESISVKVKRQIQVVTMYSTATVMKNGEVHFFQDIYGEDASLEKELAAQPRGCCGQRVTERPILVEDLHILTGWLGRPRPCQTGIHPGSVRSARP